MRPSSLTLLCLLALPSASARATPNASALLAKLAARGKGTSLLRGRFEQTKKVALFRAAVKSSGHFVVRRRGASLTLRWITDKPAPSELRFDGKTVEMRAPGATTRRVDIARAPRFGALIEDLVSFLGAGDAKALDARYAISASRALRKLNLVPRDAALKRRIARVTLLLDDKLDTRAVQIVERDGDSTDITLQITRRR